MRMTSVVCNVPVLPQNDSTYHHSVFTTWKWHPFATWTPSFIIVVWGHHPPLRRTVFACLQNCYNSCISCRSAICFTLRYDSINSNLMNYSWTNGRLAIPALAGLLVLKYTYVCSPRRQKKKKKRSNWNTYNTVTQHYQHKYSYMCRQCFRFQIKMYHEYEHQCHIHCVIALIY